MQFFRNPHPEIPMPFSFFTITLHFCTSDMGEGLFPQMWANCGIFVEQSQSFHRFSARWKNCCKRGNLSTKKPTFQSVIIKNGGGRWIALRFCLRKILTHIATRCRTRWCDSTAFHAFHGFRRDLPQPSENKKSTSLEVLIIFKWWWEMDSNHRRQCQQIYSLPPLATRESHQMERVRGVEPL